VFGERTTLILTDGEVGRCEVEWAADTAVCGRPEAANGEVRYPGRRGRLRFDSGLPQGVAAGRVRTWRFIVERVPFRFALTDETFEMESFARGRAVFRDGSGRHEVRYGLLRGRTDMTEKLSTLPQKGRKCLRVKRMG